MPSIAFGGETPGSAMRYFRADIPAKSLEPYGWDCWSYDCLLAPTTSVEIARDPRLRGTQMHEPQATPPPDVITIRMRDDLDITNLWEPPNMPEQVERARAAGQIVFYDIDDDYWKIPEWSPAYDATAEWYRKRRAHDVKLMTAIMEASDAVTVSTDAVRQSVFDNTTCDRVYVMRNGIDPGDFSKPERHDGPLRLGWMGSVSFHGEHLFSIMEALSVLGDYGVEFWHFGASRDLRAEVLHHRIREQTGTQVVGLEWVNFQILRPKLSMVDVAIIPRWLGNTFAEGHSTSSGLEWAMAGVPYIATRTAEYAALSKKGCGFVATTVDEWRHQLKRIIDAPKTYRKSIARRAYDVAVKEHGLEATGRRWSQVLDEVIG